ncbi:MAG: metal-dependent hydrolase [bacterium]
MKGFTHFTVGMAAASCFPAAVAAAAAGSPLCFILGGAFGILPDTLDFKFYRFFVKHDMEVVPDPNAPDAQMIADAVAYAINRASLGGRPVRIRLNTIPAGADCWRQYTVRFDVVGRRVGVRCGSLVDTGQNAMPGPAPDEDEAFAAVCCQISLDYEATVNVDIFEGPLFTMRPVEGGCVRAEFIGWHRQWSHSLPAMLLFALCGAFLWGHTAGLVICAAYGMHILADQCGFMGSNLWFPLTSGRTSGWGYIHSSSGVANAVTVWSSCLVIFWNLYKTVPGPALEFTLAQLLLVAGLLPVLVFAGLRRLMSGGGKSGCFPGEG